MVHRRGLGDCQDVIGGRRLPEFNPASRRSETKTRGEIYGWGEEERDGPREEEPGGGMKAGDWQLPNPEPTKRREEEDTADDPPGPHRLQQRVFRGKGKQVWFTSFQYLFADKLHM